MKKTALTAIVLLAALGIWIPSRGFPQENQENKAIVRSLAANRQLLAKSRLEYEPLSEKDADELPFTLQKKRERLEIQIRALEEERTGLLLRLSQEQQAHEMMKDVLYEKTQEERPAPAPPPAVPAAETPPAVPEAAAPPPSTEENLPKEIAEYPLHELHEKALAHVRRREYEEAARIYEEIILRNPNDDQAYIIMGHIYLMSGIYDKAESAFHNAVHIDPSNINEIAPFYENMIMSNPSDDIAYTYLGYAYLILGDFIKSKNAFEDALSINPYNERALDGLQYLKENT